MTDQQTIAANLPLTETTYFILLSLTPGPLHGYAVMKDVQALSQERVMLSTGDQGGSGSAIHDIPLFFRK